MNRIKVAVGISGGVDSAVAALLLKKAGYNVTAIHLYCWPPKEEYLKDELGIMNNELRIREEERLRREWIKKNGCRADEDRAFALKTALELEIPFKVLDFSEEYNEKVIKYFYDEYKAGRTPNPDVMCNSEIKFGLFLKWALENGFDYIATGHYAKLIRDSKFPSIRGTSNCGARLAPSTGASLRSELSYPLHRISETSTIIPYRLYIPKDKHKDQTYFLWKLTQKELAHTLFPLGDLEKSEVRKIAEKANLSVATRKDSQGICFVGNIPARDFLARRLKKNPGRVLDVQGNEIGKHEGIWFYTIGQRGGWKLDPRTQKLKTEKTQDGDITPIYYVISKDATTNTLVVGIADEAGGDKFEATEINRISETKWNFDHLIVRIRHGGELINTKTQNHACRQAGLKTEKNQNGGLIVILDKPVRGIASGQSAVFYTKDGECLGGGVIQ